ncbi:MAG: hypothetical protein AABZ85_04300 [Thermodesulfobacteriota bacterium]
MRKSLPVFLGGLAVFAVAPTVLLAQGNNEKLIYGTAYRKIMLMKDLVADILPPPAYIIESYLTALRAIDEAERESPDKAKINALLEYGRLLKEGDSSKSEIAGYYERINVWKKDISEENEDWKAIKNNLVKVSFDPAKKFFEIRDAQFNPLIKAGKVAEAKTVLRTQLRPLYEEHRKGVDKVVQLSRAMGIKLERQVALASSARETMIGGPLYNKIIQLKDIVSDVLPPPMYIIETYLTAMELLDAADARSSRDRVDEIAKYGLKLRDGNERTKTPGYNERLPLWERALTSDTTDDREIKRLMTKSSVEPAQKFFDALENQLIPAVKQGNVTEAKNIIRKDMLPLYEEHRKNIDLLVAASDKKYKEVEREVLK